MLSTYLIILTTTTLLWSATAKPSPRQTCVVSSYGDVTKSDVPAIKRAFKTCGNGGIIRFTNGITYSINDFLSIEGCKGCEVQLDGTLKQSDNITHWQTQYVTHPFQNSRLSIVIQGAKDMLLHSPSGKGLIDGNAQAWWDTYHTNSSLLRPILLTIANSTHVTLDGIKMINSPMWFNFIVASSYINFLDTTIQAKSTSDAIIANTDGFDTYQSDNVVIRGLDFDAGDDCVSFKPNSTNIIVENAICGGSHGVSVGSLAQYPGVYDIVENIYVHNVSFIDRSDGTHTQNGVRLKTWPGGQYGYGKVHNITYDDIKISGVDKPIVVDTCYMNTASYCSEHPSLVNMTEVYIRNVSGESSGANGNSVASLICSPSATCELHLADIQLTVPSGGDPIFNCTNVNADAGIPCTP